MRCAVSVRTASGAMVPQRRPLWQHVACACSHVAAVHVCDISADQAVSFAMNCMDTLVPLLRRDAQASERTTGNDRPMYVETLKIILDATDSDVLLGMAMPLVDYAVRKGHTPTTSLFLLPSTPAGRGAPHAIVDLVKMYDYLEGNEKLPHGEPGSRALSLAAVFAAGCNDVIVGLKKVHRFLGEGLG